MVQILSNILSLEALNNEGGRWPEFHRTLEVLVPATKSAIARHTRSHLDSARFSEHKLLSLKFAE